MNKSTLRQQSRKLRSQILPAYRHQAAQKAANIFVNQPLFASSQHIASYLFINHEFDAFPIMEAIWRAKKRCYVPVLTANNTLNFVCYKSGDALTPNRYGILEPTNLLNSIAPGDLDICLVPLLAFDKAGHRLGTGGGYYDRTFAFLHDAAIKKPVLWGLGFAAQETEALPADSWDIKLSGVITESGLVTC